MLPPIYFISNAHFSPFHYPFNRFHFILPLMTSRNADLIWLIFFFKSNEPKLLIFYSLELIFIHIHVSYRVYAWIIPTHMASKQIIIISTNLEMMSQDSCVILETAGPSFDYQFFIWCFFLEKVKLVGSIFCELRT